MKQKSPEKVLKDKISISKETWIQILVVSILILVLGISFLHRKQHAVENKTTPEVSTENAVSGVISDQAMLLQNFSYSSKPINPNCLTDFVDFVDEAPAPVDVSGCALVEKGASYDQASLTYKYPSDTDNSAYFPDAYIQYKPMAQKNNTFVLHVTSSGGGSGQFSSLITVEKQGDTLAYKMTIASGDRCNGGTVGTMVTPAGFVAYGKYVTPFNILSLGVPNALAGKIGAYRGLEDSAGSCFAVENHTYDIVTGQDLFKNIDLGTNIIEDQKDWTENIKYQSCFNKLYNSYIESKKNVLNETQIKEFDALFIKQCVDEK
jgi:hypothetical protein